MQYLVHKSSLQSNIQGFVECGSIKIEGNIKHAQARRRIIGMG